MYAIVGTPGSSHWSYRHYGRSEQRRAERWARHEAHRIRAQNPTIGSLSIVYVADQESEAWRYQDRLTPLVDRNGSNLPDTLPAIYDYEGRLVESASEY